MAGEEGATATLADAGTQPPAGTTGTQAEPAEGEPQPTQPEAVSLEEMRKVRSEAASLRKRLKSFEDEKAAAEEARLSESERLQKRLADAERDRDDATRALQEQRVTSAIVTSATKFGFNDPEDAIRQIDHASIEFGSDGAPTNVDGLLEAIARAKPYFVRGRGSADAGAQSPASSSRIYTRAQLADVAFFEANKADILAAHAEGRIRG